MNKRRITILVIISLLALCISTFVGCNDTNDDDSCVHEFTFIASREATCTAAGEVEHYHCTVCGKDFDAQNNKLESTEIAALGHDDTGEWQWENDEHYKICLRCEQPIERTSCSGGEATCLNKAICSVCENEYGSLAEHDTSGTYTVEREPGCVEDGSQYRICSVCEQKLYDTIPAIGHDIVHHADEGSCANGGHPAYDSCSRCDYTTITEWPHNFKKQSTVQPNGDERGYCLYTCSVCGKSIKDDFDWSLYEGHSFTSTNRVLVPYRFKNTKYTIEAALLWPTSNKSDRGGVICGNYNSDGDCINVELYTGGRIRLYFKVANKTYDYIFEKDIRSDNVQHIALTIGDGKAQLYLNGENVSSIDIKCEVPAIGRTLSIGGDCRSGNTQYLKAKLYSFTVFRDIRTQDEIMSDIVLADADDLNCCVSYNIRHEQDFFDEIKKPVYSQYARVVNAKQLADEAESGTMRIEIDADFEIDRTIYVFGDCKICANSNYTLSRAPGFSKEMFVIGQDELGRNVAVDDIVCKLTLGERDSKYTLTIDGNKDKLTCDVCGSAFFVTFAGSLDIYDNVVISNHKKVGNNLAIRGDTQVGYVQQIGGAGIIVMSGALNIYGGTFTDNEVNSTNIQDEEDPDPLMSYMSTCGGAIYCYTNLTVYDGTFTDNKAGYGGAIYVNHISRIYSATFENNLAGLNGGAIASYNSVLSDMYFGEEGASSNKVVFKENHAGKYGGAVAVAANATLVIYGNTVFDGNSSNGAGGALYCATGIVRADGARFENNTSGSLGGAIYSVFTGGTTDSPIIRRECILENIVFNNNTAKCGGAIYVNGSWHTVTDCDFNGNNADSGGALFAKTNKVDDERSFDGLLTLSECSFDLNTSNKGGAIYADTACKISATACGFEQNTASEGGAIFGDRTANVTISGNTLFDGNRSTGNGGAISLHGTVLNVSDSVFDQNVGGGNGGAIYASYRTVENTEVCGTVTLSGNTFTDNSAALGGAVFSTNSNTITVWGGIRLQVTPRSRAALST